MRSKETQIKRRAPRVGDLVESATCAIRSPAIATEEMQITNVSEIGALATVDTAQLQRLPEPGELLNSTLVLGSYFLIPVNARVVYLIPDSSQTKIALEFVGITETHRSLIRACFRHELVAVNLEPENSSTDPERSCYRYRCSKTGDWVELDLDLKSKELKRIVARTAHLTVDWSSQMQEIGFGQPEKRALRRMLRNIGAEDRTLMEAIRNF